MGAPHCAGRSPDGCTVTGQTLARPWFPARPMSNSDAQEPVRIELPDIRGQCRVVELDGVGHQHVAAEDILQRRQVPIEDERAVARVDERELALTERDGA